jgi:hypothetical protein
LSAAWRVEKLGLPSASSATISPSISAEAHGSAAQAPGMPPNFVVQSSPLREYATALPPPTATSAR